MGEIHTGGCHCGHIRYQFSGPLHDIAHCHCSICRRVSGGIVTTWITVPTSAFEWVNGTPAQYDSSTTGVRYFCPNCGAQLAFMTRLSPQSIDLTIATLDHPEQAPGRAAYLDGQPLALVAPGRALAGRSRRKPLIKK